MEFKIHILFFLISTIICSPPPTPVPPYKVSIEEPKLKEAKQSISNLRKLGNDSTEPKQFVESTKVVVNILENGVLEEHEINVTTKNLNKSNYYTYYGFSISLSQGESLEMKSNSCNKLKLSGTTNSEENDKCIATETNVNNNYKFSYNYTLFSDEYIIIKYSYLITKETPEILFRQESISVPEIYKGGHCDYKFILPDSYSNLGLKSYNFTKESDKIYSYKGDCPNEQIADVVRLSPKESFWIGDLGINFESQEQIRNNVTVVFPRMYRGGKNRNENYTITTYEGEVLNESNLIKDEIFLEASIPGKNNKKIGVNLTTAFSNKLDDEFIAYLSNKFYDINKDNINNTIKAKAEEILNDTNSEYKDKPDYYKIGKFVNSYITYDLSFHGKNLTVSEIYEKRRGVCEHYTLLYNAMLNAIGIKTIKTFGWAFDKDQTYANQSTVGHAWTVALINNSFIELDSTWDLFEGVPAGHILKGFNNEKYSYRSSTNQNNFSDYQNLRLINCSGPNDTPPEQNPSTSSQENNSPPSEEIPSSLLLPKKLLVGYDNYTLSSDEINFFAYARFFSVDPEQNIPFIIRITKNLRILEEQILNVTCPLKSFKDNMAKYECKTDKVSGKISKVEIAGNLADISETNLSKVMGANLQNQKGEKISEKGIIVLDECKITNNSYYKYIINCSVDSSTASSLNGKSANLYIVQNDDKIKEVPAKLKGNEELKIELDQKYSIKANLNNTIGKIDKGKNIYLTFKKGENSNLIQPGYDIYIPKMSSGLPIGGIIAIAIVCILLLIAAIGFVFLMRKRAPIVVNNNIVNKTTSSTDIINQ